MSKLEYDTERQKNLFRVLEAIKRGVTVSRGDLAQMTGFASGTVSEAISVLKARGFVLDRVIPPEGRGRPRSALNVRADALRLIGFGPGYGQMHMVIADARGSVLQSEATPFRMDVRVPLLDQILPAMRHLLGSVPSSLRTADGFGIALPGTVDTERGLLHSPPPFSAPNVPVAQVLADEFGCPVFVENLVLARARAERLYGDGRDVEDFAIVSPTLGLGQYVKGQLWSGARGVNPEFRHFKISPNSPLQCDCGAYGCLGTVSGALGIAMQGCAITGQPRPPLYDFGPLIEEFLTRAKGGDRRFAAIFEQAGHSLGVALSNIVNFFDPARIIVLGAQSVLQAIDVELRNSLSQSVFPMGRLPDLKLKAEEPRSYAHGAVGLAFERLVLGGAGRRRRSPSRRAVSKKG